MTEHSVLKFVTIKQRAELLDKVPQVFRRYRRVLHKGLWPGLAGNVAEQPDCPLAHGIDTLNGAFTNSQRVAQSSNGLICAQMLDKLMYALL
ncbi:hypothetical protein D3C78_1610780 [compost metagenome]